MKKKILSFLLSASLLAAAVVPANPVTAQDTNPVSSSGVAEDTDGNGLAVGKTATANGDGSYTITMEAFTTGEVKSGEVKPSDIILVLDLSTSMETKFTSYKYNPVYSLTTRNTYYAGDGHVEVTWCNHCDAWTHGCSSGIFWHNAGTKYTPKTSATDNDPGHVQFYTRSQTSSMSRLDALKQSVAAFVAQVADQEADNRIALVYFHQNAGFLTNSNNGTAFLNAKQNKNELINAINGISERNLQGATEHGKGMAKATDVFEEYTAKGDYDDDARNKVVVLVTDGEPAPSGTNKWSSRVVKQAIEESYELKSTYGASVYTVSVDPDTDASDPDNYSYMDQYMDAISSNRPNARHTAASIDNKDQYGDSYYSLEDGGWWGSSDPTTEEMRNIMANVELGDRIDTTDGGFYLTASDTAALDNIFSEIADQTGGAKIPLDAETEIRDVVTPYFNMPTDASKITIKTMDAVYDDGVLSWEDTEPALTPAPTVEIDSASNMVTISGFDFDHNFVAEVGREEGNVEQSGDFHGRKVVIQFTVTPKTGFLGGNNVPTNGTASGVYDDGIAVEYFEVPQVNVPIEDVTVTAQDKNVYLLGSLSQENVLDGATAQVGDVELQLGENGYGLDSWQYDFVNITPTINVQDYNNLTKDEDYSLTVTVSPKTDGNGADGTPATSTSSSPCTAKINVFKPEITWQDSQINAGETADYNDNFVRAEWKHGNQVDSSVTMIGTAPELIYEYTPRAGAFTQETPVKVTVKIGDREINQYINFLHANNCTFPDCKWDEVYKDQDCHFVVHIKSFDLTIEKIGCEAIDENQSFVFSVTSPNGYSTQVVIPGNGSVTIKGLPAGEYTITEDTSWSWRYEPTANPQTVTVDDVENGTATVTFNNTRDHEQWLDGNAYAWNLFDGSND